MLIDVATPRAKHVAFSGRDNSGTVAFDVLTDGEGNLAGTYQLGASVSQIAVVDGKVYANGAAAITAFTTFPTDPSISGWWLLPDNSTTGIFNTVSRGGAMALCLHDIASGIYDPRTPVAVGNVPAWEVTPAPAGAYVFPWQFDIAVAQPFLLRWNVPGSLSDHPACGVDYGGSRAGLSGIFTFTGVTGQMMFKAKRVDRNVAPLSVACPLGGALIGLGELGEFGVPEPTTMAVIKVANSDTGKKAIGAGCVLAIGVCLLPFFLFMYILAALFGILSAQAQQCGASNTGAPGSGALGVGQTANARTIIGVAKGMGLGTNAEIIAVATALVEDGLLNVASQKVPESLNYPNDGVRPGDLDSVGLFQQRTSWGTVQQRMTPVYSTSAFFNHLLGVPGWASLPPGVAAQKVQVSAYPDRYAQQIGAATAIVNANQDAASIAPDPAAGSPGGKNNSGSSATGCPSGPGNASTQTIKQFADELDKFNMQYSQSMQTGPRGTPIRPDCSGSISWILSQAGLNAPLACTGNIPSAWASIMEPAAQGLNTPGVLIFNTGACGNSGHVFMSINGQIFSSNTSSRSDGGPHWRAPLTAANIGTYEGHGGWPGSWQVFHIIGTS